MSPAPTPVGSFLHRADNAERVETSGTYPNAGVLNHGRGLFSKPPLKGAETSATTLYRLRKDNVVYSKLFAWEGSVAVVDDERDGMFVSSEFPVFDVDTARADPTYLRHALAWSGFQEQLATMGSGLGQRRQRVNPDRFATATIPLPSLLDQRRIAAHLDSVATTAEHRRRASESQRTRLRNVRHAQWGGEPRPLGELITRITRVRAVEPDSTYKMAGIRWYGGGLFLRETTRGSSLAAQNVYDVKPGDLVYNRLFAWKESFAIASVEGWTVSNEFPTFEIDCQTVLPEVLLSLLLSPEFTDQVNAASTGSTPTSRNRLKEAAFARLTVRVPPREKQEAIARVAGAATEAQVNCDRADVITDALLPAARNEVFSALR